MQVVNNTWNTVRNYDYEIHPNTKRNCIKYGSTVILVTTGVIFILGGLFSFIYTPYEMAMIGSLRMTPGLPSYNWWKFSSNEVLLKFYVFNITNIDAFINGGDTKLKVEEIGPIIYREKLTHSNVIFNENGTMTYVAKREAIYIPEMNEIDINSTIIVPNIIALFTASQLSDPSFSEKHEVMKLLSRFDYQPYKIISIYNFLWKNFDPINSHYNELSPSEVPKLNIGILSWIYSHSVDEVTVRIGTEYGHKNFFKIDKFRGNQYIFEDPNICEDKITGSTEGVLYNQLITKESELFYWRKFLCRVMPLKYEHDTEKYGISAYKFTLRNDTFYRKKGFDCYSSELMPLPNGLSNASLCYFGFPLVASSFPHFLAGDKNIKSLVEGLKPNNNLHSSYIIVDPVTGIPLEGHVRIQSNIFMKELSGFSKIEKFSDSVVPMFWIDYHQVGLPWSVRYLIIFIVQILPKIQYFLIMSFLLLGVYLVYKGLN